MRTSHYPLEPDTDPLDELFDRVRIARTRLCDLAKLARCAP
jgi:hypothetical protein